MANHKDRITTYLDTSLKKDLLVIFGTLKQFSKAAGISYDIVYRVVNAKPCTHEEKASVLSAYTELHPDIVQRLVDGVKASPTREGVEQLEIIIYKLQTALQNRDEFWFLDGGAVPQCADI